jgi:hypothetical protein
MHCVTPNPGSSYEELITLPRVSPPQISSSMLIGLDPQAPATNATQFLVWFACPRVPDLPNQVALPEKPDSTLERPREDNPANRRLLPGHKASRGLVCCNRCTTKGNLSTAGEHSSAMQSLKPASFYLVASEENNIKGLLPAYSRHACESSPHVSAVHMSGWSCDAWAPD